MAIPSDQVLPVARPQSAAHRAGTSLFPNLDPAATLRLLNRDGYAGGIQIADSSVAEILAFSGSRAVRYDSHFLCAAVRRIAHDPTLLEVVKGYIGAEPILYGSRLYWFQPPADERERQRALACHARFHYDVGDFKQLSLFFYVTDVDNDCAPHQVVRGTHLRKTPLGLVTRRLSERGAGALQDRVYTIVGRGGTGFLEDLTCFDKHRVGRKPRLMLTIAYVLERTPSGP